MTRKSQTESRASIQAAADRLTAMLRQREIVADAAIAYVETQSFEEAEDAYTALFAAVRDLKALKGE